MKCLAVFVILFWASNAQLFFTSPLNLLRQNLFNRPSTTPVSGLYRPPPVYGSNPRPVTTPPTAPTAPTAPASPPAAAHTSHEVDDGPLFELPQSGHSHFGYSGLEGPEHWKDHFPECGGLRQSPIDINSKLFEKTEFDSPLEFINYWQPADNATLKNNGHTMEVSGVWPEGKEPTITGGPLNDIKYLFKQLHFHWGYDDYSGSEHTVDGKFKPMEMHAVHWNKRYGSYDEAIKHSDGLAVLGYFWKVSTKPNILMDYFTRLLPKIAGSKTKEIQIPRILPLDTLQMSFSDKYVTYDGSLTTPPCSEIVTWIIGSRPLTLSVEQMEIMRSIVQEDGEDIHNARPIQDLNDRKLLYVP